MNRQETIKMCWITSVAIAILLIVVGIFLTFYLNVQNPIQDHHHDHRREHNNEHKTERRTLKRSDVTDASGEHKTERRTLKRSDVADASGQHKTERRTLKRSDVADASGQHKTERRTLKRSVADLHLKSVLRTLDTNNDDFITKQEVMESLKNIGIPMKESEVDDMIRRVDANGDGLIDLNEFCTSFDGSLMATEGEFKEVFDVFDRNSDGFITADELALVINALGFKEGNKMGDCKEMIKRIDMDGDGKINFLEFKKLMIKSGHKLVPIN